MMARTSRPLGCFCEPVIHFVLTTAYKEAEVQGALRRATASCSMCWIDKGAALASLRIGDNRL